jgi:hypothetical protein
MKKKYDMNLLKKKLIECQSQMSATLEIITDNVAMRYLGANYEDKENRIKNRTLDEKTVKRYMDDMIHERWEVAQPILFDIKGNLIDGQGRLTSVVKTGIPIITWVIRGLSTKAFQVIDKGKRRSLRDSLTTLMVENSEGKPVKLTRPACVGSAIVMMHNLVNNVKHIDKDRTLTTPEVVEMVRKDFDYYEEPYKNNGKSKISNWRKRINYSISASIFGAFYYTYKRICGNKVNNFLDVLTSNVGNTPIIVRKFRDDILENKSRDKLDKRYLNATAIIKRMEVLFKYYQQNILNRRKDFLQKDLV